MKHRKPNRKAHAPAPATPGQSTTPNAGRPLGVRNRRWWLMRLAAVTLVPLFLLTALELGLRVVGYGHSSGFWRSSEIDGQEFRVPNHKFSYRFFPPALARTPLPIRVAAEKPEGIFRIFLFGESAAHGEPDPAYGVGRHLEVLLSERYPGTDFEVVPTTMTAINSHAILPIARDCTPLQGDLWILYMGNNEMVGAYGAGTIFSTRAPPLGLVRFILAVKTTRVGQLLEALVRGLRSDASVPESWGGIEMFSKNQLRHDDPGRLRAYQNFRGNMESILQAGHRAGVPILLSTVASNLKDCAPFASLHAEALDEARLREWQVAYEQGKALEVEGSFQTALASYSNAAAVDAEFAELQFRIGACHLALTNLAQAREAFERARDYDALVVRADARINSILRAAAEQHADHQVVFVDAAEVLADQTSEGIPGREQFYEHVHFTLDGNYQLARAWAEEVAALLPASITATGQDQWVDAEVCQRELAVTLWNQLRMWKGIGGRLSAPPFTRQSNHEANSAYCEAQVQAILSQIHGGTLEEDHELYTQALAKRPDDSLLHAWFAGYLEATGSLTEAIEEWRRVCELLPDLEHAHYYLGEVLVSAGQYAEAITRFERALEIRSDFTRARKALNRLPATPPTASSAGE